ADYAVKRVEEAIVKNGGATADGAKAISDAISALRATCTGEEFDKSLYDAAVKAAEDNTADSAAANAVKRDLRLIAKIYNVYNKHAETGDLPDTPDYSAVTGEPESKPEASEPETVSGAVSGEPAEESKNESGSSPLNAIVIAASAAIALGAVIFTVLKLKKKK
ncbi:MAG: hypothetical protein IK047_06520, partial [Clostridia bacterium]|nr:hypothetical protein [Clostridia bacterium]